MVSGSNILIVEHSPEMARLYRRLLLEEPFMLDVVIAPAQVSAEVTARRPDLLVLDIYAVGEYAFAALDELRADEVARAVPVVVTTTSPEIAQASLASYNVRAAFVKPFDLDEFVDTLAREVGRGTMQAAIAVDEEPPSDFAAHAERVLARQSRSIIFRWIQRLRGELPWSERDDLDLADLIDYAPVVLQVLDVRLHYDHPSEFMERHPEAVTRAQEHARLRATQGIPFGAALREYALLRDEVWYALKAGAPSAGSLDEVLDTERAINGTLDAMVTAAAAAFAEEPPPPGDTELPYARITLPLALRGQGSRGAACQRTKPLSSSSRSGSRASTKTSGHGISEGANQAISVTSSESAGSSSVVQAYDAKTTEGSRSEKTPLSAVMVEVDAGLLAGLAEECFLGRLTGLDVARRAVPHPATA